MPRRTMPLMGVRNFRESFPNLTKSVRVIRSTRKGGKPQAILGTWTPEKQTDEREEQADNRPSR
jgi:hypothetical protein